MKKSLLTMVMALGLLTMANAQDVKPYSDETLAEIKATPEQIKQVKDLTKEFRKKLVEIQNSTTLNEEEKKQAWIKLRDYRLSRYWNEILTPEQSKYLKEKQKKMKAEEKKS